MRATWDAAAVSEHVDEYVGDPATVRGMLERARREVAAPGIRARAWRLAESPTSPYRSAREVFLRLERAA
jgi:hypothetical protein